MNIVQQGLLSVATDGGILCAHLRRLVSYVHFAVEVEEGCSLRLIRELGGEEKPND